MSRTQTKRRRSAKPRKGTIVVLSAFLVIIMMAMLAFSIDVGYMSTVQSELDRSVDAGALAGAAALVNGTDEANNEVRNFIGLNPILGQPLDNSGIDIETGRWDDASGLFIADPNLPSAIKVRGVVANKPYLFARALGHDDFSMASEAVAVFQPRDMMVVLDFSASMNDDSEFKKIPVLGQEAIETNLAQIYGELGSPSYGNLTLDPRYVTFAGDQPEDSEHKAHIDVEYRSTSAKVTSTKPLYQVRLYFGSYYQTFYNKPDGYVFAGTDGNLNRRITNVRVKSGYNSSNYSSDNRYEEYFDCSTSSLKSALGLSDIAWPFDSGSWSYYVDHCCDRGQPNATQAGYLGAFGYLNWVNYLLEEKPRHNQTDDLWKVSAQPVNAVKNAMDVYLHFVRQVDVGDRVGLAIYTSASGTATLEQGLSEDLDVIEDIYTHRQAGHYHTMTNVGAGIKTARQELDSNARPGAFKLIILMTDGLANMPNYSTSQGLSYAREQTGYCEQAGYPIMTISLGTGADTGLMDDIANQTGGEHFNVPGGRPVAEYEADLMDVFRRIAEDRPLRLVH